MTLREEINSLIHDYQAVPLADIRPELADKILATLQERLRGAFPNQNILVTKYGYYAEEKKYGYRIAMSEFENTVAELLK